MSNAPFGDRALQTVRVSDFSAGIVRFGRGLFQLSYAPRAPVGSASDCRRCIAEPGVGLVPLPEYVPCMTYTKTAQAYVQVLSVGNQMALAAVVGNNVADSLVTTYVTQGGGADAVQIGRADIAGPFSGAPVVPTVLYTNALAGGLAIWTTMDAGFFQDPTTLGYRRVIVMTDPSSYSWITVADWLSPVTPAAYNKGALPTPTSATPRVFYHAARVGVLHASAAATDAAGFGGAANDRLDVSDILSLANFSFSGFYFPEMGSAFGTWGSISTGELALVYTSGGAVLLYGDMFAPTSVYKLPGVVGTGFASGKAALSPAGMVYATSSDGAYSWNGNNNSQKISEQIPDDVLFRNPIPDPYNIEVFRRHTSQVAWNAWVMFPNNWLYDTDTSSWWLTEDPTVVNFQVNCAPASDNRFFYGTPGFVVAAAGQPASLTTYQFDRFNPVPSYMWTSNPIPVTADALVSIQQLEVIVSNPSAAACTVTLTPTIPAGQQPFAQQNQGQAAVFTVPANTVAWRGSQRVGYTDYNIMVRVDAANTNPAFPAPTVHEFTVGYTTTRVAGVQ